MRVILEKPEIIEILNKHFDSEFQEDMVIIRTEPVFEIELRGISMGGGSTRRTASAPPPIRGEESTSDDETALFHERAHGPNASLEPPEPGADGLGGVDTVDSPLALVQRSKEIAESLERQNPKLYARPPRREDGVSSPPTYNEEEIS